MPLLMKGATMKIRIKKSFVMRDEGKNWSFRKGAVVDVDADKVKEIIELGWAEKVATKAAKK